MRNFKLIMNQESVKQTSDRATQPAFMLPLLGVAHRAPTGKTVYMNRIDANHPLITCGFPSGTPVITRDGLMELIHAASNDLHQQFSQFETVRPFSPLFLNQGEPVSIQVVATPIEIGYNLVIRVMSKSDAGVTWEELGEVNLTALETKKAI